eukprot:TRINITY_DN3960_c0_g1_i1.p1 TRINITY_DN3960_c0_g1~~TRINITY_DN3960_c0_g1_i1.p1  ORF type:complete len:181 (+),score=26.50 TRINITY_DN3960_c0_g1_i1:49-591(+)
MSYRIRKATILDQPKLEPLIVASVKGLMKDVYTTHQIELSSKSVFGLDTDLISDGTYFVAETSDGEIVGCGGWSKRKTLYGASRYQATRDASELDPKQAPAKIRAFYISPSWARRGIGSAILRLCEEEARTFGFGAAEMMATLSGVQFYTHHGYAGDERFHIPVGEGEEIVCVKMSKNLS